MMRSLDVEAIQAFVLAADLQSFTRAAEALETTQSAISLKIKKLEDGLGRRLLERTPRLVRLSADGSAFIGAARDLVAAHQTAIRSFTVERRRLVVGISHHIGGAELPILLKRLNAAEPRLVMEMRVASSREVLDEFDRGGLDAAIVLRHDDRRNGETILNEAFGWMSAPDFEYRSDEPLRLASQAESCSVRKLAIAALDSARIPWTEVFVGGGVSTIGAAVSAGLAVAAMARRVAPAGTIDVGAQLNLPALPTLESVLHSNVSDRQGLSSLRTLAAAIRSTAP